jgi:vacuolar-type H+-ATPase subunit H
MVEKGVKGLIIERLKQLTEAELEAEKLTSMAEQKANSILENAHREGEEQTSQILDEAHLAAEGIIFDGEKEAEIGIQAIRERAENQKKIIRARARENYNQAVSLIIERITRQDGLDNLQL